MRSIGLFRRKELWVPTLRGWALLLVLVAATAVVTISVTVPFLAPVQPIGKGVLIVEGWLPDYALESAKQTFERHPYRCMVVTGVPIDQGFHISVEKDYAQLARGILTNLGMNPDLIVPVACPNVPRDRTYATARAAAAWLEKTASTEPVDVFTLGVHARRTWLLYSMVLGDRHPVGIIAGADRRYDPGHWWKTSSGVRTVASEVIAYLYARLLFRPDAAEASANTLRGVIPRAEAAVAAQGESGLYRSFSIPITVEELPPGSESVLVSASINFNAVLERLGESGCVDERSLRLFEVGPDGAAREQPLQFMPIPQPRLANRALLPGTPNTVSYLGEHPAGQTVKGLEVAGELTWSARADKDGRARYRLDFGVPQTGRAVQVPFPPQNLRMFDLEIRAAPARWFPEMQFRPQWPMEGRLHVFDSQALVTTYYMGPQKAGPGTSFRRPFLYPLNGPEGVSLTEFGKPHDPTGSHAHHYSLWIAHANVDGKDFWSETGGAIAHDQFELLEDGPLFCKMVQKTRWIDRTNALLTEQRQLTFYRANLEHRLIDVVLRFTPAHTNSVTLGKTSFGFLAARVAQSMTVFDGGGEILNANGDRNEQGAHLKRAAWIDQSGPIAPGKWNGLAILEHPENRGHPNGWHCRNDGWAGAAFNMDQPFILKPGPPLELRYRLCLHRHGAVQARVAKRYAEYAANPVIRLSPAVAKAD